MHSVPHSGVAGPGDYAAVRVNTTPWVGAPKPSTSRPGGEDLEGFAKPLSDALRPGPQIVPRPLEAVAAVVEPTVLSAGEERVEAAVRVVTTTVRGPIQAEDSLLEQRQASQVDVLDRLEKREGVEVRQPRARVGSRAR